MFVRLSVSCATTPVPSLLAALTPILFPECPLDRRFYPLNSCVLHVSSPPKTTLLFLVSGSFFHRSFFGRPRGGVVLPLLPPGRFFFSHT